MEIILIRTWNPARWANAIR